MSEKRGVDGHLHSHAENKAGAITQEDETNTFLLDQCLLRCFSGLFFFVFEVQLMANASIDRTIEFPFSSKLERNGRNERTIDVSHLGGSASMREDQYSIQSAT